MPKVLRLKLSVMRQKQQNPNSTLVCMWRSSPRRSKVSCLATLRHGRDVTCAVEGGFNGVNTNENHPTIKGISQAVLYDPSQSDYMKDHGKDTYVQLWVKIKVPIPKIWDYFEYSNHHQSRFWKSFILRTKNKFWLTKTIHTKIYCLPNIFHVSETSNYVLQKRMGQFSKFQTKKEEKKQVKQAERGHAKR